MMHIDGEMLVMHALYSSYCWFNLWLSPGKPTLFLDYAEPNKDTGIGRDYRERSGDSDVHGSDTQTWS